MSEHGTAMTGTSATSTTSASSAPTTPLLERCAQALSQSRLQIQLLLMRCGLLNCLVALLLIGAAVGSASLLPALRAREQTQQRRMVQARKELQESQRSVPHAAVPENQTRLAQFYSALGDPRYTEQQLKTFFALADKAGLRLTQGEYKLSAEKDGRYHTYQLLLPVKGSYRAIRQFCEQALVAMPFASLDEINVKRETIGNGTVEARLRWRLYLAQDLNASSTSSTNDVKDTKDAKDTAEQSSGSTP